MSSNPEALYAEQFRSAGQLPVGPISPWPRGREIRSLNSFSNKSDKTNENTVKATPTQMAKGLLKTGVQAIRNGQCSVEVRTERLETCFTCPHFLQEKARCGLCGCYMKAKTWVGGDPKKLCPAKKWVR